MTLSTTSILRLCAGIAAGVTLLASDLTTAAASPTLVGCPSGSVSIAANTSTIAVCITQQGNSVVILVQAPGPAANASPAPAVGSSSPLSAGSTYAQRQAIRDQYRGQIDELTFNDELGDGVSLSQALADAMAARATANRGVNHR